MSFTYNSWIIILTLIAISEPTATVLIGIFCELAKNTQHADKIYSEVRDISIRDVKLLATLPHLEAVIAESLRLYPALPTGGNRKTPDHGIVIGGRYIPPQTTVVAPRYSISRSKFLTWVVKLDLTAFLGEDCFERANEFIPERWYLRPDMIHNKSAFAPFGTGKAFSFY